MERGAEKARYLNGLSGEILDASIEVHKELGGPGLLESIYEESLARELTLRGLEVQRQVRIPVEYKGAKIHDCLVLDLLVAGEVVVEVKSVEKYNPIYSSQVLTYLRLSNKPLGLIINFGEKYVKEGFHRVVHRFPV